MKKILALALIIVFLSPFCAFATSSGSNRKAVTTAGIPEALTTTDERFSIINICASANNTGTIVVGDKNVVASISTRKGIPLDANDCYTITFGDFSSSALRDIYIDSTVSGDSVTWHNFLAN